MSDADRCGGLGPLQAGDRVAVIAPSGPASAGHLDRMTALPTSWGLDPVVFPSAAVVGVTGVALGSWRDCGPVAEIHAVVADGSYTVAQRLSLR